MAPSSLASLPSPINVGVVSAKQATMLGLLGHPCAAYDRHCREVTNPRLKALVTTERVGRLKVRGLRPAVASLRAVLEAVEAEAPEVAAALGSAGMLCARHVRGSAIAISNHAWGTAIDLTLDGALDGRGDGKAQAGLARIAPIFNRHGWFWGAAFRVEDAMHFECGDGLIRAWHASGVLGPAAPAPAYGLSLGDRGPEIAELQRRLNSAGATLVVDGIFGRATHAAVGLLQATSGLEADGIAGPQTLAAIGCR